MLLQEISQFDLDADFIDLLENWERILTVKLQFKIFTNFCGFL